MWTSWTLKLCAPLASAAVLTACMQKVDEDYRHTATRWDADHPRTDLRVSLTGCLEAGTGNQEFILTHVEPAPVPQQPSDAVSAEDLTIPFNASVRLAGEDKRLSKLVGERISIMGLLRSDGHDTIGTSGWIPGAMSPHDPRTDYSMASASGVPYWKRVEKEAGPIGLDSMSNGTFPEVAVLKISDSGRQCAHPALK